MQTILVTGGAGYIGSHVCKALKQAGFLPVTYDNLSTGHAYAVKWGPLIEGDLTDKSKLKKTIQSFDPVAVMHFAGSALVFESMQNPSLYYQNNVVASCCLLEVMKECGIQNLLFSSTCATYGNVAPYPIKEDHPQNPINPYGRSKWMIEQMIKDFEKPYGIQSMILRYFNAAGADQEGEIGEHHDPETHLIPNLIQAALGKKQEAVIYGDGSAVRDYIHVKDLADVHVLSLLYLLEKKSSHVFNVGSSIGYSVLDVIDAIEHISGVKLPIRWTSFREGDPSFLMADTTKAKQILGWTPSVSGLSTILESAWKWHQFLHRTKPLLEHASFFGR